MIIQMKGANITTANNATFGNITAYNSAGQYEFNYIGAINGLCISLTCPLINTYNLSGAVQLVRVPVYANAVVTNTLTAQAWNGTTGGVLAFESTNLTFNSDINVDALGFRGGAFAQGGFCCSSNNFVTNSVAGGQKGEAIAAYIAGQDGSKGKNANGGGGTNCGNSGGGGGANGGAGGIGGNQYNGCGPGDQGVGGINLTYPSPAVLYLGGGGGGFRDNGQIATVGGNGGAIVFIISNQITCNNRIISSRGADVTTNAVDEGSGGGGSGGSVFISCPTYLGNLTINAQGGRGGSNFNTIFPGNCHGPGGGGGGGVYAFSTAAIPPTVTYNSAGGAAGLVLNTASTCFNTSYGAAAGSPGISLNNLNISVTVPTVTIAGPTTVCVGSAVTLTASGSSSYTWNVGPTTPTLNVSPTAQTIYTVVGGAATCTSLATYTVSTVNVPTVGVTGNFSVCANVPTVLTANGATNYLWSNGALTAATSVTPAATTIYTVVGAIGTCTSSTTATVNVNPAPTPTITSNTPICAGQDLNFTGSGGLTYQWNGPGFSSASQNPTITAATPANSGTYTLTVTDANNCSGSTTQIITVNPLPAVNATGSTVCINQTLNLNANGGTSYSWTGPGGFSSALQNPTIPNANLVNIGQYTVVVTDVNTCSNTAVTNASVNPIPTPTIGSNGPICVGNILSLAADGGLNYSWSGPNGFFASIQNPTVLVNSTTANGNYNVTVSDAIGCSSSTVIAVVVNNLPSPSITANVSVGCAPLCPQFICSNPTPISLCSFNMDNATTINNDTASHCYSIAGNHTITAGVTDMNGCFNSTTYVINVHPVPVADFNFAPIRPVINGENDVYFTDASHGANVVSWNWYFMNTAQYTSTSQNPHFLYEDPGDYVVALVVNTDKGCTDTILLPLKVYEDYGIYVPNVFTPNADGLNDVFQAKGFGITKFQMMIYDRWGEKLFETNDIEKGWDGTKQSKHDVKYGVLADGSYTWQIKLTNVFGEAKEFTGHVILMK
ncbi:MAG: gliding motility-associated C-terminal domain-containing protein [Sphingobacteriaceae bacterium]|nr:gliding motility-associated C-terminal domain-containing protein [Sphingobacteriaceae bacterium]